MRVIWSFILFFISFSLNAGWWRTYGGSSGSDYGYSVQQTTDGGYIIAGYTDSYGAGDEDVYLIKTDAFGNTIWTKTYAYGGINFDEGWSVQQTSDGGYIVVGNTYFYGSVGYDVYLIKTNASGDTLWTRTYGGSNYDYGCSVQQTTDGGYILAGWTESYGAGYSDVYLIKTDASGNTLWTRTYGGSDPDEGSSVQQTSDGGYIVAGITQSYGAGWEDVYLIKTDASGDTIWTRTYGGSNDEEGWSVQKTSDGGYIVAGWTDSYGAGNADVYLIKTDASGGTIWTKTYGGSNEEAGWSVQKTSDGGYIVAGKTYSYGAGAEDVYLIKTNASGNTIWTKTYGGSNEEEGLSVQQTTDGGYIVAGWTNSYGAGSADVYLIKTDANGVSVEELIVAGPTEYNFSADYSLKNKIIFRFTLPKEQEISVKIYDVAGRYIFTPVSGRYDQGYHEVDVPIEGQGVYFYSVEYENTIQSGKFLLVPGLDM